MATISGAFRGQDLSWLKSHQIELRNALSAIAASQSYSIGGRQVTMADYPTLAESLSSVTAEINRQVAEAAGTPLAGASSRVVYPNFGSISE